MVWDYLIITLKNVKRRGVRSWLTVLGVVIGVMAVVALITVSNSLRQSMQEQLAFFGADRIFVIPKTSSASLASSALSAGFDDNDVKSVSSTLGVDYAVPYIQSFEKITFNRKKEVARIWAFPGSMAQRVMHDYDMSAVSGRLMTNKDSYVIMLGNFIAKKAFDGKLKPGSRVTINKKKFRVIGILSSFGNPDDDSTITMPLSAYERVFPDKKGRYSMIDIKVSEGASMDIVAGRIKSVLKRNHGEEDFSVMTAEQISKSVGDILSVLNIVLGGIAAISLIVGGIGIMNSIFTGVFERTKEIGIMKAMGARNSNILAIFLTESSLIGLIGGIIGILLGWLFALAMNIIANAYGYTMIKTYLDPRLVLFALLFSLVVGFISGFIPSKRAASLNIVDSIREG